MSPRLVPQAHKLFKAMHLPDPQWLCFSTFLWVSQYRPLSASFFWTHSAECSYPHAFLLFCSSIYTCSPVHLISLSVRGHSGIIGVLVEWDIAFCTESAWIPLAISFSLGLICRLHSF